MHNAQFLMHNARFTTHKAQCTIFLPPRHTYAKVKMTSIMLKNNK